MKFETGRWNYADTTRLETLLTMGPDHFFIGSNFIFFARSQLKTKSSDILRATEINKALFDDHREITRFILKSTSVQPFALRLSQLTFPSVVEVTVFRARRLCGKRSRSSPSFSELEILTAAERVFTYVPSPFHFRSCCFSSFHLVLRSFNFRNNFSISLKVRKETER